MGNEKEPTPEEILAKRGFNVDKLRNDPIFLQKTLAEIRGTLDGYNLEIREASEIIALQTNRFNRNIYLAETCQRDIDLINLITASKE